MGKNDIILVWFSFLNSKRGRIRCVLWCMCARMHMCVRVCTRVPVRACACEWAFHLSWFELPTQRVQCGALSPRRGPWFQTELKVVSVHGAPALWVAHSDLVSFLDLAILYLVERGRHPAMCHVLTGGLWGFRADPRLGWSSLLQAQATLRSCGSTGQFPVAGVLGHQSIVWHTSSSGFSFCSWPLGFSVLFVRFSCVFFNCSILD